MKGIISFALMPLTMLDATAASARTIVLLGPTAGGKSDLALELARRLGGELVSADSMQVYRGMDIGTAKPTAAERAEIPHHAIDLVDATDNGFTVASWLAEADRAIDSIRALRTPMMFSRSRATARVFTSFSASRIVGGRPSAVWRGVSCVRCNAGHRMFFVRVVRADAP